MNGVTKNGQVQQRLGCVDFRGLDDVLRALDFLL